MKITGSQIVIEVLVEQGVDTVFGYPGGTILNIYDALYLNQDRLRHIITAHEQGAAHAADGYARATGKTGVVLATSGPGATNLVTGIATAYMDSVPMVAITANVGTSLIGKDSFQEVYIAGITMPITKHNYVVRNIEDLADTLRSAFRIAQSGRPGPVLVDIPKDVTAALCEFEAKPPVTVENVFEYDENNLRQIAEVINQSERPVIYFGGGATISKASNELLSFMEKAQIPACNTIMGIGVLDPAEPLNLGMVGMHGFVSSSMAIEHSDVLIAIGTRFSDRVATNTAHFAPHAKIIHIDIDAAEINKNVSIGYSIIGDVSDVLSRITPLLTEKRHDEWLSTISGWQKKLDYRPQNSSAILKPHQIMNTIVSNTPEDAIYVTDVGQHQMWAAQYCQRKHPRLFLTSGGMGTMGFGYGAAMGAKTARPEQTVIHITGDGCFHMNLNELCTAVSFHIPVITVLFNNGVLGMVRQWQKIFYEERYSSTTLDRKTDYVKLAEAFGAKGWRCTTPAEFETAFQEALAAGCPCVIDCVIDRDERVLPMIPAGGTIENIITN